MIIFFIFNIILMKSTIKGIMQTISVYLNKRASSMEDDSFKKAISHSLFRSNLRFREPVNINELNENLVQDIDQNVDAIVSVGGDGTVNTLIQKLSGTDIGLLVIPGGTANDLACELGNQKNIKRVIQNIRSCETKKIDLVEINGKLMATNGGIGFGSDVAQKINSIRAKVPAFKKFMNITGKNVYSIFALQELLGLNLKYHNVVLESEEFSSQVNAATIMINNQPILGGTFNVAPGTANNDGKVNVTLLTHKSRQKLIRCVYQLAAGQYPVHDPDFISFETSSLKIKNLDTNQPLKFFGDGEILLEDEQELVINVRKQALKVYTKSSEIDLVDRVNEVTLQ